MPLNLYVSLVNEIKMPTFWTVREGRCTWNLKTEASQVTFRVAGMACIGRITVQCGRPNMVKAQCWQLKKPAE